MTSVCHCLTRSVKQCSLPATFLPSVALLECGRAASIVFALAHPRPRSSSGTRLTHRVKQCSLPATFLPSAALLECGRGTSIRFPQADPRPHSREWDTPDAVRRAVRSVNRLFLCANYEPHAPRHHRPCVGGALTDWLQPRGPINSSLPRPAASAAAEAASPTHARHEPVRAAGFMPVRAAGFMPAGRAGALCVVPPGGDQPRRSYEPHTIVALPRRHRARV